VSQARIQKQQREKARRERAAGKWARRQERVSAPVPDTGPTRDEATVLAELAALHERFAAGLIGFDDFEESKRELTAQLDVR
jgi:hypothetical protein